MAIDSRFPPPHPGEYLREDVLPALGMSVKAMAADLGVSRQSLSELINERRSVPVEMTRKLGKAVGNGARFWLALQMQHDLWHAEQGGEVDVRPLSWEDRTAA
jgi:addiction module HigA family antidote